MALILDGTTGVPVTTVTGTLPVANGGSGVTTSTGTGANVLGTSPTLATPTFNSAQLATVSGTAPLYMCRAWVNFNGTGTVAINSSGNVSSITDNAVGDYTANFTTTIVDTNYAVIAATCARGGFSSPASNISIGVGSSVEGDAPSTYSTSAVRFYIQRSTGAGADLSNVSVAIFR